MYLSLFLDTEIWFHKRARLWIAGSSSKILELSRSKSNSLQFLFQMEATRHIQYRTERFSAAVQHVHSTTFGGACGHWEESYSWFEQKMERRRELYFKTLRRIFHYSSCEFFFVANKVNIWFSYSHNLFFVINCMLWKINLIKFPCLFTQENVFRILFFN